jgi:hypothetical protein
MAEINQEVKDLLYVHRYRVAGRQTAHRFLNERRIRRSFAQLKKGRNRVRPAII